MMMQKTMLPSLKKSCNHQVKNQINQVSIEAPHFFISMETNCHKLLTTTFS